MLELAMHILDIAENSSRAGASLIEIRITEDQGRDLLRIEISDNGHGMDDETLRKALDPFYTTKTVRRVGLGLSLFADAARRAGGEFSVTSTPETGTTVVADFVYSHIDRQPLGDVPGAICSIILGNPSMDMVFTCVRERSSSTLDTRDVREELKSMTLGDIRVVNMIRGRVEQMMNPGTLP